MQSFNFFPSFSRESGRNGDRNSAKERTLKKYDLILNFIVTNPHCSVLQSLQTDLFIALFSIDVYHLNFSDFASQLDSSSSQYSFDFVQNSTISNEFSLLIREMQMERDNRWKDHNGDYDHFFSEYDGAVDREVAIRESSPTIPITTSSVSSSPPRLGYIEHPISKLDTLVGIAIKYGVEVADIKKMNGLVTDHQMFALKTLHIPLPGRHPPSPCLSNGFTTTGHSNSDHSPADHAHRELSESFQSLGIKSSERKVSPAMSSLQGYYGLKLTSNPSENGSFSKNFSMSHRPLSHHRKSKSLVNVILEEVMEKSDVVPVAEARDGDSDKWNDKFIWRRQKSEADFTNIPELLMRPDNSSSGGFPLRIGKGLSLRQKVVSRNALATDSESSGLNPVPTGLRDDFLTDGSSGVRKSPSTSCLQDQDNSSSIWPTSMWSLKPDLQAFSAAAIRKPIFDGMPKPATSRRNKAALD